MANTAPQEHRRCFPRVWQLCLLVECLIRRKTLGTSPKRRRFVLCVCKKSTTDEYMILFIAFYTLHMYVRLGIAKVGFTKTGSYENTVDLKNFVIVNSLIYIFGLFGLDFVHCEIQYVVLFLDQFYF